MKRGKILAASLAIAGGMMVVGLAGSTPASAQGYACAQGYYFSGGYCYPYAPPPPPVSYYPPSYYYAPPPPVVVGPAFGINLDFGGGRGGGGHGHR